MADTAYIAKEPKDEDENVDMLFPLIEHDDGTTLYWRTPYRRKYHFRIFDDVIIPESDSLETGGEGD